jgi:hypothetical protein
MIGVLVGFSSIFLLGILIFKGRTARRLCKSFGVKGLTTREKMTEIIRKCTVFCLAYNWPKIALTFYSLVVTLCTTRFNIQKSLHSAHTANLCVSCGSQNEERLSSHH